MPAKLRLEWQSHSHWQDFQRSTEGLYPDEGIATAAMSNATVFNVHALLDAVDSRVLRLQQFHGGG